jgi:predicted unusual protein kinase regulating ubiquinone biosynthesis (AarF/ABC1/UbiB family)
MSDFPSSRIERTARMARTGLRVGTNYALHHLKERIGGNGKSKNAHSNLHATNARYLYDELSKLRGTALKLAQTLSLDHGLLPEEFVDVMSQAQYRVPPISRALVRQIIKDELGGYPEEVFAEFRTDATAAASIGQVHEAVLRDGRKVMVKIQYPNVRVSIGSDLSMAKLVFRRMVHSNRTDDYFREVYDKMMEETDYRLEGEQITMFHERYNSVRFAIPEYLPEYSTASVLTMTRISGEHIDEFLARDPGQDERDLYGQLLWDFFHAQINDTRSLHADAHPGNYMLCSDGRLGVLDFGCIKECPPGFFRDYVSLMPLHFEGDRDVLWNLYGRLGLVDEHSGEPEYEASFFELCKTFGDLVISPYRSGSFNFGDAEFSRSYKELVRQAAAQPQPRGTHHFIYVTRAHVGLYRMLMNLGAVIDPGAGKEQVLGWWEENRPQP